MIPFWLAFGLTVLSEGLVLWALFHRERSPLRIALATFVANAATHPVVFLVLPRLFADYAAYVVTAEVFAFAAEVPLLWALLRPRPASRAVSASALANATSYALGLAIFWAQTGRLPGG